jgi:hypothetical protein
MTSNNPPTPHDVYVVELCGWALNELCMKNRETEGQYKSHYHSSRIPGVSVNDYLKRIAKYSRCSPESFVITLIYLDRYTAYTGIPVCYRNVHRLLITIVMVAAKLRDDIYYSNAYYASIGGVTLKELNALEAEMLRCLEWKTWVEPRLYTTYFSELGTQRGAPHPPQEAAQS